VVGQLRHESQGEVDRAVMSLDEAEATFTRRAAAELAARETLARYAGTYETPTGARFQVVLKEDGSLGLAFTGAPFQRLLPWKPHAFRVPSSPTWWWSSSSKGTVSPP